MMKMKSIIFPVILIIILFCNSLFIQASDYKPEKTEITYCTSADEGRMLINWNKKQVDGYELILTPSNKSQKVKTYTYDGDRRKSSLSNLPTNTTYQVKIRTFNLNGKKKVYSTFSNIKTITIHKHTYVDTVMKKSTCTEKGYYIEKCSGCGRYYRVYMKELGHDYQWVSGVDCEEYKCSKCGEIKEKKDHEYQLTNTIVATCTTEGKEVYTCKNCGDIQEKNIDRLNHNYQKVNNTYVCTLCGDIYADTTMDQEYTIDLGNGNTTTIIGHYDREMEEKLYTLLDDYRKELGLSSLNRGSDGLKNACDIRAYEIGNTFDHKRPNGNRAIIDFKNVACGEILAINYTTSEDVINGWKNSPSHNNIMIHTYPKSVSFSVFAAKCGNTYQYCFTGLFGY